MAVLFVTRFGLLMTGAKPYSNVKSKNFVTFFIFAKIKNVKIKVPSNIGKFIELQENGIDIFFLFIFSLGKWILFYAIGRLQLSLNTNIRI